MCYCNLALARSQYDTAKLEPTIARVDQTNKQANRQTDELKRVNETSPIWCQRSAFKLSSNVRPRERRVSSLFYSRETNQSPLALTHSMIHSSALGRANAPRSFELPVDAASLSLVIVICLDCRGAWTHVSCVVVFLFLNPSLSFCCCCSSGSPERHSRALELVSHNLERACFHVIPVRASLARGGNLKLSNGRALFEVV